MVGACATAPHRFDQENSGRWKARTLIKDLSKKKSHILYAEILAQRPGSLRVDVTTSLGIHLARVVLNEESLSYILTRERKYFNGPATAAALKPVLGMPLDPKLLVDMLFDQPPTGEGWTCQRDKKDYLQSCVSSTGVEVIWSERSLERRTVAVKSARAQLQLELTGFQSKVEVTPDTFVLAAPKGFKPIGASKSQNDTPPADSSAQ